MSFTFMYLLLVQNYLLMVQPSPPFLKGGIDLIKNPKRERGIGKLLKGRGDPKEGFCRKGGNVVCLGISSSQGVTNVTTVTFNYIFVIMFLFPLNVGVSPCFYCTVLVPVYRVYTSCFHNAVVSSCYRLHTSCLHHPDVTCFSLSMLL